MADQTHTFTTARARLEEIVAQVRQKDTSLEKSLDLLEEGVRLANACTELIDSADWAQAVQPEPATGGDAAQAGADESAAALDEPTAAGDEQPAEGEDAAEEPIEPEDPSRFEE